MKYERMNLVKGDRFGARHVKHIEDSLEELYSAANEDNAADGQGGLKWEDQPISADCYKTNREELGTDPEFINSEYIWGMYDAVVAAHPDQVEKREIYNDDKTFTNYEYVVRTGGYIKDGVRFTPVANIEKPKYLVSSGIHGNEIAIVLGAYRFFRDLVEGKNLPKHFGEGVEIHFLPVTNPEGVDGGHRANNNGVDPNRNFDYKWVADAGDGRNPGASPNSEKETQAVVNWLKANLDASLYIDCHTSSANNWSEIAAIIGLADNEAVIRAKRIALRGLDRIVSLWRNEVSSDKVYPYASDYEPSGCGVHYAAAKLGITSFALECSSRQDDPAVTFTPSSIAILAEALGNVLLEMYEQDIECTPIIGGGTEGQFAVSDGNGGIKWLTVFTEGEVGY